MKYKLSEEDINLLNRIRKITLTNYGIDELGYIEVENLLSAIDDLEREVDELNEKIERIVNERDTFYRHISREEYEG